MERVPVQVRRRRSSPVNGQSVRLRELLEHLVRADVAFVLVGGLAVNSWGYIRGTQDVDIVPNPEPDNLERLAAVLEQLDGQVVVGDRALTSSAIGTFLKAGDKTLVRTRDGDVDVLQGLPQVPRYAELAADAIEVDLDGLPVQVCSLPHLMAMKRASGRPRDLDDLEALEAAHAPDPTDEENDGR